MYCNLSLSLSLYYRHRVLRRYIEKNLVEDVEEELPLSTTDKVGAIKFTRDFGRVIIV